MADSKKLRLASQYPTLSALTGFGQPSQADVNPLEQILAGSSGPSATSGARPFADVASIGSDNAPLASNINDAVQNIFALVRNASTNATNNAKEAAAKRAAEEANAKAVAMQARILKAQKDAAISAVKNSTTPTANAMPNTSGPSAPLISMPPLPKGNGVKKLPKVPGMDTLKFPKAKPPKVKKPPVRDPRKPGIQN